MILCVQCAMRATLAGEPTPQFDQTIEEHMRQYHPDLNATAVERRELEQKLRDWKYKK